MTADTQTNAPSTDIPNHNHAVHSTTTNSSSSDKLNEAHDHKRSMDSNKGNNYQFESNRKYFSISIYALCVIFFGTSIIYCIINMDETSAAIKGLTSALSPFFVAFFIAYILSPVVNSIKQFLERICHIRNDSFTKSLSIICTYIIVLGVLTITMLYIIPQLTTSIQDLANRFSDIGNQAVGLLDNLEQLYPYFDFGLVEDKINEFAVQIVSFGTNMVKDLIPAIISFSVSIVKILINLLLSVVISIYMLNDKKGITKNITRGLFAFFPEKKVSNFIQTAKECNSIFSNFIIGKSLDSLIIGILCFIIMTILRLPYALLLSVIVGITNMIPYFGPFIGAVPGALLYLVIDPIKSIIFCAMILALQQFDGLILGPKILGNSTGLKPLWVIFAITIGGYYWGVLGMFLGVPVVGVISFLVSKAITTRLKRKNLEDVPISSSQDTK